MEFKKFGVRRGTSFLLGSVLALLTSFGAQAAEAESTSTTLIDELLLQHRFLKHQTSARWVMPIWLAEKRLPTARQPA